MFGVLNINKPAQMTSRTAVNHVCKVLGTRKVGHAGTLDPMATGVLLMLIGPATRLVDYVHQLPKSYRAEFQFGFESSTEDRYGELTPVQTKAIIDEEQVLGVLPEFVGQIEQMPPAFSALKVDGKRAYKLARKGEQVELRPRQVHIHRLELLHFDFPKATFSVQCGSGTYIRSLGRDIGRRLGTGAYMTALERTSIGPFGLEESMSLPLLEKEGANAVRLPQRCVAHLPQLEISNLELKELANGTLLNADAIRSRISNCSDPELPTLVAALGTDQRLIAILEQHRKDFYKPKTNFSGYWKNQ